MIADCGLRIADCGWRNLNPKSKIRNLLKTYKNGSKTREYPDQRLERI
jgi:hypothetical protein